MSPTKEALLGIATAQTWNYDRYIDIYVNRKFDSSE